MNTDAVVVVDNLRYRYPGRDELALDGVSWSARRGQFIGIVGPNGSGKSTMCHALVGLVPHFYKGAVGGRVTVAGIDVHRSSVVEMSRRVGLVFQNPFTQITGAKRTVYEEVAFGLEYAGVPREEMIRRIDDALHKVGLGALRDRSPYALSGGQMQRLAIAAVLAMEPHVLVLDEPTSQLDPAGTREVFDAVNALCDSGMTVVMAEHDVTSLAERADHILVLNGGRVADWGPPRAVFGRTASGPSSERIIPLPPATEAARALGWRLPEGNYPVSLAEAVTIGKDVLQGKSLPTNEPPRANVGLRSGDTIVSATDIHFHYTADTPVIKGLTLHIGPGTTAIIGQNGAGKSTFVKMLNGLLKPIGGDVTVAGVNTRAATVAALARTVGLVFQNPAEQLFKSNVLDEVMFGPLNLGKTRNDAEQHALDALERVGLTDAATVNPYDLGLAERKLVTVAGVLAMGTDVIILDEPTIAQDALGVARLGALVTSLRDEGRTVITITHDMDFVARFFDRVIVLAEGELLADDTAAKVFSQGEVLTKAAVEAPQITELGRRLGLQNPVLTPEDFVTAVTSLGTVKMSPVDTTYDV